MDDRLGVTVSGSIYQRVAARIDRFLFEELAPTRLAICRIIYYLALYWLFFVRPSLIDPQAMSMSLPDEFFFPQNAFRYIPIASPETRDLLAVVLQIALLLAAAGFLTRITSAIVFALLFYLLSVPGMYGKFILIYAIPIIVTGVLACSRCGDALSVDRWIRARWSRWPLVSDDAQPSGHYRWPLQVICVYLVMVFCFAALSKLVTSGLAWALSDNLSLLLRTTPQNQACTAVGGGGRIPELAAWVAERPGLAKVLALGVLATELSAPLALCSGIIRYLVLAAMAMSTLSFYYLVGPDAWPILFVFCFFIPWERWRQLPGLRRRLTY